MTSNQDHWIGLTLSFNFMNRTYVGFGFVFEKIQEMSKNVLFSYFRKLFGKISVRNVFYTLENISLDTFYVKILLISSEISKFKKFLKKAPPLRRRIAMRLTGLVKLGTLITNLKSVCGKNFYFFQNSNLKIWKFTRIFLSPILMKLTRKYKLNMLISNLKIIFLYIFSFWQKIFIFILPKIFWKN